MLKILLTAAVLFIAAGTAAAQSPAPAGQFRAVGSTGKLLTSGSRDYWNKMGHRLHAAEVATDAVTDKLHLPHVNPVGVAAAAKTAVKTTAPARKDEEEASTGKSTLWLGADKLGSGFKSNGH